MWRTVRMCAHVCACLRRYILAPSPPLARSAPFSRVCRAHACVCLRVLTRFCARTFGGSSRRQFWPATFSNRSNQVQLARTGETQAGRATQHVASTLLSDVARCVRTTSRAHRYFAFGTLTTPCGSTTTSRTRASKRPLGLRLPSCLLLLFRDSTLLLELRALTLYSPGDPTPYVP